MCCLLCVATCSELSCSKESELVSCLLARDGDGEKKIQKIFSNVDGCGYSNVLPARPLRA